MMGILTKHQGTMTLLAVLLTTVWVCTLIAGDLNPPAPPTAGTMKTLDQVEPRIPIPGSSTAATPFIINQSGSYYLTGDRLCSTSGIQVDANDVTIDLMGYSLIGSGFNGSGGVDIYGCVNVEVRNGTVRGFYTGINENSSAGRGHRIINVRAVANTNSGIKLYGERHLVKDCTVTDNGAGGSTLWGINAGAASLVTGNTVCNNGTAATGNVCGISVSFGSTIAHNTVNNNGASGSGSYIRGLYVSMGCTVIANTVYSNGKYATSTDGTVYGINLAGSSLVDQNTVLYNGDGTAGTKINMNNPGTGVITASNYAP